MIWFDVMLSLDSARDVRQVQHDAIGCIRHPGLDPGSHPIFKLKFHSNALDAMLNQHFDTAQYDISARRLF